MSGITSFNQMTKQYYYNVLHWQIKLYLQYVRSKSYPVEYWSKELKKSLKKRNQIAKKGFLQKIINQQLSLF